MLRAMPTTVGAMFSEAAAQHGDREAVVDGSTRLSFRELDAARLRAARAFAAAGLAKGDRIAIWSPNLWEFVAAAAGAQTLGGVLVPLNTRFKAGEAIDILRRSRARWLFTVDEFLGNRYPDMLRGQELPDLQGVVLLRGSGDAQTLSWDAFLAQGDAIDAAAVSALAGDVAESDMLDLMFTSGTTGRSKAVIGTHGKTLRTFDRFTRHTTLCSDDRYLIINPFFHTFGYKYGWVSSVLRGSCMYPVANFDVDSTMALIERERITFMPGTPTIYQMILDHPRRRDYDLSSLRMGQTGGSMIPVSLVHRMYSELGLKFVLTGYGLTESCGIATSTALDDDPLTIATTVGQPCIGIEMRIAGPDGAVLPPGATGEILLRGDNLMLGYFDDEAATAAAIDADGFLHTGDVGSLDERGYLRITDRIKDLYIVGGFNCYPAEIENMLHGMPGVAEAAVIGVADERLGEVGKAYIVAKPGAVIDERAVIAWCREQMANFKVPRSVEFLDCLPRNASGKILKAELRQRST